MATKLYLRNLETDSASSPGPGSSDVGIVSVGTRTGSGGVDPDECLAMLDEIGAGDAERKIVWAAFSGSRQYHFMGAFMSDALEAGEVSGTLDAFIPYEVAEGETETPSFKLEVWLWRPDTSTKVGTLLSIATGAGESPDLVTGTNLYAILGKTLTSQTAEAGDRIWASLWITDTADIDVDYRVYFDGPTEAAEPGVQGSTATTTPACGYLKFSQDLFPEPEPEPEAETPDTARPYARALKLLLPRGLLWNLEPDTKLDRLLLSIGDELLRVVGRGEDLVEETDPRTASETLADWERFLGIPDDIVTSIPATDAERRLAIAQKYIAIGGQSPAYFIGLAAACGYTVTISDSGAGTVLRSGIARSGDSLGNVGNAYEWTMTVAAPGGTALTHAQLEAAINKRKPAHTSVNFVYL